MGKRAGLADAVFGGGGRAGNENEQDCTDGPGFAHDRFLRRPRGVAISRYPGRFNSRGPQGVNTKQIAAGVDSSAPAAGQKTTSVMTPEPTVLPPSRTAKRPPTSRATGLSRR